MPPRPLASAVGLAALLAVTSVTVAHAQPKTLGFNVHQSTGIGLDATAASGTGMVRIDLNWLDAQPSAGAPDFTLFDAIVDGALARGLTVLGVIGYTPAWASQGDMMGDGSVNDVPVAGTYDAFVAATVSHFQGRITHYELWNEPNLDVFFEGTVDDYNTLILGPGAAALRANCGDCRVVAPGLASIAGEYADWLDAVLTAHEPDIDIVSGHIYAGFPGDETGAGSTSDSFFNKLDAHRVLETGGSVIYEGPPSFFEVMQKHQVQKPFWLTETGQSATLGDTKEEATQTLYYRRVLEAMLSRPQWQATLFYEAFDVPGSGYEWGAVVEDGSRAAGYAEKPVMDFLRYTTAKQPLFGGNGADCNDGLDNDGDGFLDWPDDPGCTSALAVSEVDAAGEGGGGSGAGGSSAAPVSETSDDGCALNAPSSANGPFVLALLGLAALLARRRRG